MTGASPVAPPSAQRGLACRRFSALLKRMRRRSPLRVFAPGATRALALVLVVFAWQMVCLSASAADAAPATPQLPAPAPAAPVAPFAAERGLPAIRNFAPRVYNGANQIWCSVVARDGTLYFGAENEVIEFDGQSWRSIPVPHGSYIRCLALDRDDVIWVGGVDELGKIVAGPDGRRRYVSLRAAVPASVGAFKDTWSLHATADGIWFQSNQAVLRWRNNQFDVWMMNERALVLSYWLGDYLLVARLDGWYRPGPGGTWEPLGRPEARLGDYLPHFALPHPDGHGWLLGLQGPKGAVSGLARWDGHELQFESYPFDEYLRTKRLFTGIRLRDGRYVLTFLQGGALVLGPHLEFQTLLTEKTGLPADVVISATEDAFGAVWLGTEYGISRVQLHPAFTWFTAANGLNRGNNHPVIRWRGQLLVGDTPGLMRYEPPATLPGTGRLVRWTTLDDKIRAFAVAGDDLLAGSLGGLWQIRGDVATKIDSLSNIFTIQPSVRQPGRVWVASLNGLAVYTRTGGEWQRERALGDVRPNSVSEAADGAVWVGTDTSGVCRLILPPPDAPPDAKPDITRFGAEAGLPASGKMHVNSTSGAPLITTDVGLYRYDATSHRFRPETAFGRRFSDGSTRVHDLCEDGQGGAWLVAQPAGSPGALGPKSLGYARGEEWHPIPIPDSVQLDGFTDLEVDRTDGHELLWLNGESALLRLDVAAWRQQPELGLGATAIYRLGTGPDQALDFRSAGPRLQIPPGERTLHFSFGTPGLAGEPDAAHETRLLGFANGEAEVAPGASRTFTNLPAGHYTFEARGRSADGRWSAPATLAFEVLAPWWQHPLAWAGYALLLATAIYAIVQRRTYVLERERVRLEAVVATRTAEIAEKNRELERLNRFEQDEKLSARLAEEKARLELLRYQLNPHFLFNSLNSIRALVYANPEAAGEMVTRLAEFCRWTLTRGSDETTTVAEELEMIRTYLDIEKARWQDALVTQVEVGPGTEAERLPQFLLLPLIENAIKYGGRTSPGTLEVRVSLQVENGHLLCEVANTGTWVEPSAQPAPTSTHIGLDNLRQRLARHYGPGCTLEIVRETGWVRMRLRLRRGLPASPRRPLPGEPFTVH